MAGPLLLEEAALRVLALGVLIDPQALTTLDIVDRARFNADHLPPWI